MTFAFDSAIAEVFPAHARAHIPNYDQVIDLSVDVCRRHGLDAEIIEVGVATGETIARLHAAGFRKLTGVDSSQHMLDKCPQGIAKLVTTSQFPDGSYDVVLMNWTLHFIKDKVSYLERIFSQLRPGGILVLSEKPPPTTCPPLSITTSSAATPSRTKRSGARRRT